MNDKSPETTKHEGKPVTVQRELTLLSIAQKAFEEMGPDGRSRAFHWFKSKYEKEWPRDQTY